MCIASTNFGYLKLTYVISPEEGAWVAECPELGVASCGDTENEALDNIRDAVVCHLKGLAHFGNLEEVFRERQIEILPGTPPSDVFQFPRIHIDFALSAFSTEGFVLV